MEEKSSLTTLTNDQLQEYIKKQHVKVKKLQIQIDSLQKEVAVHKSKELEKSISSLPSTSSSDSSTLFWDMIKTRPSWQQNLARVAVSSLAKNLYLLNSRLNHKHTVKSAFCSWLVKVQSDKIHSFSHILTETKKANNMLEQR